MSESVFTLKSFRKRQKPRLSLEALAQEAGVSVGHLSKVERFGTANLRLALRLSEITGLPVNAFAPRDAA
jgi:transcriptional regulator with XRE-family HTH domain